MNAQVYYRKWRPKRFDGLVGQEHVARTLKQAVARGRIAHAYLFCGPRGTGKTSTARVLAKAANCPSPQDGEPCNECRYCTAVNEGRALDLIEVDAASNRGIDEIRNIREKVHYSPTEARYKVYVLDEAHMLTDAAADALLKTLEEPPDHVIFVMATTDPQKLASTIVSRCQRYDFRRVELSAMDRMLAQICEAEAVEAEPAALHALARNADGSMRDAESLLEQTVTSFGQSITLEQVQTLLGLTSDDRVRLLIKQTLAGSVPEALTTLSGVAAEGLNLRQLHRQMVDEVRDLLLIKSAAPQMVARPHEVIEEQTAVIESVAVEQLLQTLRLLGQVTFRNEGPPVLALELAIIEAAQVTALQAPAEQAVTPPGPRTPHPRDTGTVAPTKDTPAEKAPPPAQKARPSSRSAPAPSGARGPVPPADQVPEASAEDEMTPPQRLEHRWDTIVKSLSRFKGRRFYLGSLLRSCRQYWLEGDTLYLMFSHQSHMDRMKDEMDQPESRRRLTEVITKATGIPSLNIEFLPPNASQRSERGQRSPLVQAALSLGGRIIEESEENDE